MPVMYDVFFFSLKESVNRRLSEKENWCEMGLKRKIYIFAFGICDTLGAIQDCLYYTTSQIIM